MIVFITSKKIRPLAMRPHKSLEGEKKLEDRRATKARLIAAYK
jgi:hypothetical protein